MTNKKAAGSIAWADLTVPDADSIRDFYKAVVGWTEEGVDMGGYQDYCMNDTSGKTQTGVCHARGVNQGMPAQWMIYVLVDDVAASADKCEELGGKVLHRRENKSGNLVFAVLQDPSGAVIAVTQ